MRVGRMIPKLELGVEFLQDCRGQDVLRPSSMLEGSPPWQIHALYDPMNAFLQGSSRCCWRYTQYSQISGNTRTHWQRKVRYPPLGNIGEVVLREDSL